MIGIASPIAMASAGYCIYKACILDEKTFDEQKSDIWVIILKYLLIVLNT